MGTTATNGQLKLNFATKVLAGDTSPGFSVDLAHKDLTLIVNAANASKQIVQIGFQRRADPRIRSRTREQAGEIQKTVGLLLEDVRRLDDRVEKLKGHFAATEKDLRDLDTSADRITKRGQRILDVDLGEEPTALPKP